MPIYTPTAWVNAVTAISAARLNNLETQNDLSIREEGSHLAEQSTNNLASTAMSTVGGLTIETDEWILIWCQFRKDAAAAATVSIGLQLNAVEVKAPVAVTAGGANADSGIVMFIIGPGEANYLHAPGLMLYGSRFANGTSPIQNVAAPGVQITDITIKGLVANALLTLSTKNLYVYTFGG